MKDLKEQIEKMAKEAHSYDHINTSISPNENTIYMLWNDGEITSEKGSWAFGMRSVFTKEPPIFPYSLNLKFPLSRYGYSGAILSLEECCLFRSWICRLLKI